MKKKIMIFMLLLSFLVGVGVPDQAKAATETTADDVKYKNIEDYMYKNGYTDFIKDEDSIYLAFNADDEKYMCVVRFDNALYNPYFVYDEKDYWHFKFLSDLACTAYDVEFYQYYSPYYASLNNNYNCLSVKLNEIISSEFNNGEISYMGVDKRHWITRLEFEHLIYSDVPIYSAVVNNYDYKKDFNTVLFDSCLLAEYVFPSWCEDAGLNCLASTNESPTKIPYSYNDYWHIVRKTSNGKWLLTTIGNSVMQENITDYTMMLTEDGNLAVYNLYSGEDTNGYKLNIRQYEYDTDGWKVCTYETFDARDDDDCIIDLGSGSGFDQTRILAYTNVDIYDEGFNVVHPVSTEYYEVTDTPVVPEEPDSTSPTPTTIPSGGGSGSNVGGQAKPGGMLDFIITFFTLVWTKLFAVEVPVDGYNISFQSIVIFGAIAGVLIWLGKSSFGKKG